MSLNNAFDVLSITTKCNNTHSFLCVILDNDSYLHCHLGTTELDQRKKQKSHPVCSHLGIQSTQPVRELSILKLETRDYQCKE